MRFMSLKSAICDGFALSTKEEVFSANKVVFVTPSGFVEGSPVTQEFNEISTQDSTLLAYKGLLDTITTGFEQALERSGDSRAPHDGYILLRDVEIRPYAQETVVKLEALVLFTGDISGVFLTQKQSQQN